VSLREALVQLDRRADRVVVRFREVDPVPLEEVRPAHLTSCILHTSRRKDLDGRTDLDGRSDRDDRTDLDGRTP
jgi:hypothetical protein